MRSVMQRKRKTAYVISLLLCLALLLTACAFPFSPGEPETEAELRVLPGVRQGPMEERGLVWPEDSSWTAYACSLPPSAEERLGDWSAALDLYADGTARLDFVFEGEPYPLSNCTWTLDGDYLVLTDGENTLEGSVTMEDVELRLNGGADYLAFVLRKPWGDFEAPDPALLPGSWTLAWGEIEGWRWAPEEEDTEIHLTFYENGTMDYLYKHLGETIVDAKGVPMEYRDEPLHYACENQVWSMRSQEVDGHVYTLALVDENNLELLDVSSFMDGETEMLTAFSAGFTRDEPLELEAAPEDAVKDIAAYLAEGEEDDLLLVWEDPPEALQQLYGTPTELEPDGDRILLVAAAKDLYLAVRDGAPQYGPTGSLTGWAGEKVLFSRTMKAGSVLLFRTGLSQEEARFCFEIDWEESAFFWPVEDFTVVEGEGMSLYLTLPQDR